MARHGLNFGPDSQIRDTGEYDEHGARIYVFGDEVIKICSIMTPDDVVPIPDATDVQSVLSPEGFKEVQDYVIRAQAGNAQAVTDPAFFEVIG